jgi:hypothetical protein
MLDDVEGKPCPFVGDEGCTVYEDRPWACRMYPLGLASPMDDSGQVERFFFLLEEDFCKGHLEQHENTVAGWIDEQGVAEYDEAGELFKPVSMHPFWDRGDISPSKMDMFFMASYDVDRFRRFIFDSTFLDKFVVDDEVVEQIRVDDTALMRFGFDWLRFALFEEPSMKLDTAFKPVQQREKEFFDRDKDR